MEETLTSPGQPEAGEREAVAPKEPRKRQKRLLNQIADQMDFYFSAANITKDHFMSSLLSQGPYIDLQTFFKFNKIRSMTTDIDFLRKAITKSSILELSEDGHKVRRKTDVEVKENEVQCTIYVENVPSNADHDWVRQVFGEYGAIDYISLPRYHRSGRPKGFAFVEFKTSEMANSALEAFGALECKIPSTIDPAELQSIKTFEGDTGGEAAEESEIKSDCDAQNKTESENVKSMEACVEEEGKGKKRKLGSDAQNGGKESDSAKSMQTCEDKEEKGKKRKLESDATKEGNKKKRKPSNDENTDKTTQQEENMDASEIKPQGDVEEEEEPSVGGKKSKKKKRKRNKKGKEVIDSIYLRVMSKEDWKKLRNKYLNTQRENMKLLKMQLQERHYQQQFGKRTTDWNVECGNSRYAEQDTNRDTALRNNTAHKEHSLKPQYTPNSVIKISFEEPPQDPKKLRDTIREGGSGGVAYVDVSATERDVFVRFLSEEAATSYKRMGCWSRMEVLSGAEEKEYWERIVSCWTQRRNKKSKQNGKRSQNFSGELRGREKLLQKAVKEAQNTKCNSHIVFDD